MRPTWKRMCPLGVLLLLLLPVLWSYYNYSVLRVDNSHLEAFKNRLESTVQQEPFFRMRELTSFDRDLLHVIPPYASKPKMAGIVGREWTTAGSYLQYLLEKTWFGRYPLDDDLFHKLVFVKGEAVVLDITLKRSTADFLGVERVIPCGDDFFVVDRTERGRPMITRA